MRLYSLLEFWRRRFGGAVCRAAGRFLPMDNLRFNRPLKTGQRTLRRPGFAVLPTVLAVFLVFSGCTGGGAGGASSGGGSSKQNTKYAATPSVSVPYAMSKTMNPFTADSMVNLNIAPLLYDTLTEPDASLAPQLRLAASANVSGSTVNVALKNGLVFSDGSALTASDVAYSFQLAMNNPSGPLYARVSNIASVAAQGGDHVVFTLKSPDPMALNMLDVPIIKAGSDRQGTLVGSGRYVYKQDGNNATLTWNPKWYQKITPAVKAITLVNMPDDSTIASGLDIGTLDYVLSDYGTNPLSVVNAASSTINLNQLLYIGVNNANKALANAHVRNAVSALLDRTSIAQDVYSSHALAASVPFNPLCSAVPKTPKTELVTQPDVALKQLGAAGFTNKNADGVLTANMGGTQVSLSFSMLVNKDDSQRCAAAQKISDVLKTAGIMVKVNAVDSNTLTQSLQSGSFDLYLGEIKLPADLDVSAFFTAGGAASYGKAAASSFYTSFSAYRSGTGTLEAACKAFASETPFIPVCFRLGTVSYKHGFHGNIIATSHDIFYNIQDWQ